jgi:pyruvate/2-oxoglutarate dehydrogenase complex dihydrolipoamide acyltransferase (E2) component
MRVYESMREVGGVLLTVGEIKEKGKEGEGEKRESVEEIGTNIVLCCFISQAFYNSQETGTTLRAGSFLAGVGGGRAARTAAARAAAARTAAARAAAARSAAARAAAARSAAARAVAARSASGSHGRRRHIRGR